MPRFASNGLGCKHTVTTIKKPDKYEKKIQLAYGKGDLVSTSPTEEEKKLLMAAAKATPIPRTAFGNK